MCETSRRRDDRLGAPHPRTCNLIGAPQAPTRQLALRVFSVSTGTCGMTCPAPYMHHHARCMHIFAKKVCSSLKSFPLPTSTLTPSFQLAHLTQTSPHQYACCTHASYARQFTRRARRYTSSCAVCIATPARVLPPSSCRIHASPPSSRAARKKSSSHACTLPRTHGIPGTRTT